MISPSSSRPKTGASASLPGNCRILFGHQSVGKDLLRGIRSLDMSASISDLETTDSGEKEYGIFCFRLGKNGDPYSKIDYFSDYVLSREAHWDVAVMKLCYVDINQRTDVRQIVRALSQDGRKPVTGFSKTSHGSRYRAIKDYPTRTAVPYPTNGRTRRRHLEDNQQRDRYNSQLRATFSGRTQLFDLAQIEATQPDGNMCAWPYRSRPVPGLYAGFTDDGGHLNDAGAKAVAREFMALIDDVWT